TVLSLRYRSHTHRYIHSFPTRRSSDLSQTRGDPDAVGYMWGMAGELDDTTVGALAGYYAEQKTEPSSAGRDSALVARGREIYERSEEHTSELQSLAYFVCSLMIEKKNN